MSEFNIAVFEDVLPDVENFLRHCSRKRLMPDTAKRLKKANEAVESLRKILNQEKEIIAEEKCSNERSE